MVLHMGILNAEVFIHSAKKFTTSMTNVETGTPQNDAKENDNFYYL